MFPMMGVYVASKFALEALGEAYRYELKPTGVEVTIVQPGPFPTDLPKNLVVGANQDRAAGYGPLSNGVQLMANAFAAVFEHNPADSQMVANDVMSLVHMKPGTRPPRLVVDTVTGHLVRDINAAVAEKQRGALEHMQMGMLAD